MQIQNKWTNKWHKTVYNKIKIKKRLLALHLNEVFKKSVLKFNYYLFICSQLRFAVTICYSVVCLVSSPLSDNTTNQCIDFAWLWCITCVGHARLMLCAFCTTWLLLMMLSSSCERSLWCCCHCWCYLLLVGETDAIIDFRLSLICLLVAFITSEIWTITVQLHYSVNVLHAFFCFV